MTLVLFTAAVVALCAPRWLAPLMRRLAPRDNVRACVGALGLGALLVEVSASAFAVRALVSLRLGASGSLGRCLMAVGTPGHSLLGVLAAVAAVLMPALAYRGWRRARDASESMRADPFVGLHRMRDGIDFVRLPTRVVVAYSIDGPDPQVVISDGLVGLLSPSELDAVLGHETAHLREHHGRMLRLLAALEAPVSVLAWVAAPLRVAIERRADEAATQQDPARRTALLDALLKVAVSDTPLPVAAFTRQSCVLERAEALLFAPHMRTRAQRMADRVTVGAAACAGVALMCVGALALRSLLCALGVCCM